MDASNRDEHFSASGRTPEMGLNRHRRFLPGLVRTGKDHRLVPDLPSLDPRDTADLLAHVLEISRLIRFFESGDTALGHWDDVLSLSPSILSAGFLEHGARTESRMHAISSHLFSGSDTGRAAEGPVMGSAMAPAAKSDADALALLGAEYLWQKKWEDAFRRAGTPCDLPDIRFPDPEANQMPGDRVSYRNAALVLGLRRSRLTAHAGAILDAALLNPQGRLQPHEGMLVSVLHLFHPVRRQQDDLVSRYTDYFLETMPHTRPAPLRPDRVLITCGASGPAGFTLPAGTRLEASAALPLVYTTESEAFIRDFSIQKIQSIVPLNPPGPFYKSLVWTEFAAERGKTIRDLFGQAGRSGTFHTCVSLVSLPGLELSGGTRTLDMALVLAPETGEAVSGGPELSGVLKNGGKTLFDLALSTAEGWVTPENPTVDLSPWTWPPGAAQDPIQAEKAENPFSAQGESGLPFSPDTGPGEAHRWQLRLSFTLPPDVPALCPPDLETHGISASAPALCIRPKDEKSPFWRKLKDFSLRRIHVSIQVRGLRAFNRLSDGGWMVHTPDMAVESFGTLPGTGSAFTLAVPEFRGKKLKTLRLGWNWEAPDDFAGYFRAYDFFPVKIVPDFQSQADAWETLDEPRTLSGKKDDTLDCPLPPHGKIRAYRWRLVSTGSLFGHRDYPHLLTRATLNESTLIRRIGRAITHGIRLKDLNPPYTPVWSDITLDYAAEVTCFPEPGEHLVRYLHPHADPFPEKPETPFLFFHQNTHALALSLDFPEPENRPVPLSLYFRVQNRTENTAGQPFQVDGADVMTDETGGLTQSGILQLLARSGGIVFSWDKRPDTLFQGIHENAAWAVFQTDTHPEDISRPFPLPAETPFQLGPDARVPPWVKAGLSLHQPYPSSGGRGKKTEKADFYQDAAETLSHREQAILPKDYERLCLREFPVVCAVRCLSRCDGNLDARTPGAVCLVVFAPQEGARIHHASGQFTLNPGLPCYTDAALLQDMHQFLAPRISPHIQLTVRGPVFEGLGLNLKLCLDPWKNEADARAEIRERVSRWMAPWAFEPEKTTMGLPLYGDLLMQCLSGCPWCVKILECRLEVRGVSHDLCSPDVKGYRVSPENRATLFYPEKMDTDFVFAGEEK